MTSADRAEVALARLSSELNRDRAAMDSLAKIISDSAVALTREPVDRRDLSTLGLDVHRWYTGLEALLERVDRTFGSLPSSTERWHQELLEGACLDIPGVRPAIVPSAALTDLMDVLRFRHFLRHAYGVELDPQRLSEVVAALIRARPRVSQQLDAFQAFLDQRPEA